MCCLQLSVYKSICQFLLLVFLADCESSCMQFVRFNCPLASSCAVSKDKGRQGEGRIEDIEHSIEIPCNSCSRASRWTLTFLFFSLPEKANFHISLFITVISFSFSVTQRRFSLTSITEISRKCNQLKHIVSLQNLH